MMLIIRIGIVLALNATPNQDITTVKELYREGRFAEARAKLNEITPTKSLAADLLLYHGLLELDAKKARAYLEKLIADHPESRQQYRARFIIAQLQFIEESYKETLASLRYILKAGIETGYHSPSCFWMGRCYEALSDTAKAISWYERVDEASDPASWPLAAEALKHLKKARSIYSVQIGSFKSKESAHELAATYAEKGYETWLATTQKEDTKYYKVLIGEFDSREMAEGFLELFAEKESITYWIVKVRRL